MCVLRLISATDQLFAQKYDYLYYIIFIGCYLYYNILLGCSIFCEWTANTSSFELRPRAFSFPSVAACLPLNTSRQAVFYFTVVGIFVIYLK